MSGGKNRIPRNMARIEFLACREEIENLLSQGFDKKKIHTRLLESGKITMSYDALCKVLLHASQNKLHIQSITPTTEDAAAPIPPKPAEPSISRPLPNSGPRIVNSAREPFPDPRKMSLEDGI